MGARAHPISSRQERRFFCEPFSSLCGLTERHTTQGGREQNKGTEMMTLRSSFNSEQTGKGGLACQWARTSALCLRL
jgi:hypothetical protein